jgi:hypothetical protein
MAVDDDQTRPFGFGLRFFDRAIDLIEIVDVVDCRDVPSIGVEPFGDVFAELFLRRPFEGDMVRVEKQRQLAKPKMQPTGKRGGLAGDALHHVAFAAKRPGAMVDNRNGRLVVPGRHHAFGDGHADGVGNPLSEGACGDFDARRHPTLRVSGRAGIPLAKLLQILDREVVAAEMKTGIQQHRRMAAGQHETVAVRPVRMCRIVP